MSCVFVSSRQAGRERGAREGEEGDRERYRKCEKRESGIEREKVAGEEKLIFIYSKPRLTAGSSAWINTFPHRHIHRWLSSPSASFC